MRLCFDSFFRPNVQFVFIAVILSLFTFYLISILLLFYSALYVPPYLLCLFNVISVITTSSNHAFSGFQCFPARVTICPDESLLLVGGNVGVVFTFTTVELRLLLPTWLLHLFRVAL